MENQNAKKIEVGMIVSLIVNGMSSGWYRVTRVTKNTVNLGSVFGRAVYRKSVPITDVVEDEKAWYSAWSKTETYQCM